MESTVFFCGQCWSIIWAAETGRRGNIVWGGFTKPELKHLQERLPSGAPQAAFELVQLLFCGIHAIVYCAPAKVMIGQLLVNDKVLGWPKLPPQGK